MIRWQAKARVLLAISLASVAAAQETSVPSFKADASSVVVDVIVTDHKGRHIQGLKATDFSLNENGVPQRIVSFTPADDASEQKTSVASAAPRESDSKDTGRTVITTTATQRPHLLTVVLDLADNRPENLRKSCETVLKYLDKNLTPSDYVAIYYVDRGLHLGLPFTNNLTEAREALKKLEQSISSGQLTGGERASVQRQINDLYGQAHPNAQLGMDVESASFTGGQGNTVNGNDSAVFFEREMSTLRSYLAIQNTYQAKAVFVALRAICLSYKDIPGRKNVILFSEGFLYADDARKEMEAVADAANRANVAFYVIDPVGLEISGGGVQDRASSTTVQQMTSIAMEGPSKPGQHTNGESKFDHMRTLGESSRNEQLGWLADTTGGLMVKNTNDLLPAFSKVVEDARDFYTLVYQPTNKEFDGKFRGIKVDLQEKGYQLRYRQGYWAIPHSQALAMTPAAAQLISAATKGSLKPAFSVSLKADILLAPNGKYSSPVSVSLPGNRVPLQKGAKDLDASMLLVVVARDSTNQIIGVHQRDWHFQVAAKERDAFQKKTLTLQTQMPLPDLQAVTIRAILQFPDGTSATGETAATPTAKSDTARISTILLSDFAESATCSDNSDPLCVHSVRLHQPAAEQFPASTRVIVYFTTDRLALDAKSQKPRVGVSLSLKQSGKTLSAPVAENIQAMPGPTPDSVSIFAEYDLKSLSPGPYVLHAVTTDLVRKATASQETGFSIQ